MFPWAVICATFFRFRRAAKKQLMIRAIPEAAVSPLQPYLAIYGLFWSSLISSFLKKLFLIIVVFQGYEVFSRHNPFWHRVADSWGYTVAPWLALFGIAMLVFVWLFKENYKQAEWNWGVPRLRLVNFNGVAPLVDKDESEYSVFKRTRTWVLNNI
jgi:amino acid permease